MSERSSASPRESVLFITGASGFLGRCVVAEAVRRGHKVRALVRPSKVAEVESWGWGDEVEIVAADLRDRERLADAVRGDVVLHLAAAKEGDLHAQYAGTVVATENLLAAMERSGIRRIVHVSSFSVYDYAAVAAGSLHDESSPVEVDAFERDDYARAKLLQERLVRDHAEKRGWAWTILRPGMIIGPDNLWSARIGSQLDRLWLQIGLGGELPVTHVENAAEAVVLAAESDAAVGQTFDVVDDERPTRREYLELLRAGMPQRVRCVRLPWRLVRSAAVLAAWVNRRLLDGRARLPGLLIPACVDARFKPLRFSNRKLVETLGWRPRLSLRQAIDRSLPAVPELRLGWMTGEFPRANHVFMLREIDALRGRGLHVEAIGVRRPPRRAEAPADGRPRPPIRYLLPPNPLHLATAHLTLLARDPKRYFSTAALAFATRPPGVTRLLRQAAYFAEAALVVRLMRRSRLAHLHNHFATSSCTVAMLAAELGGFRYSFTMHGPGDFIDPAFWRLDEKIRRAAFAVCISDFARRQALEQTAANDRDKLHVVHCGVPLDALAPRHHDGRGTRVLFVGRLEPVKGVPLLVEAIAVVSRTKPEVELDIVGDGSDRAGLEAQAERLGIAARVRVLGFRSQSEVRDLLRRADVFALPSFAEGVPMVLMEAMAAGVPVVATRIAGVPELVEDGVAGFLVAPGDVSTLAEKIALLLEDAEMRNRFGAAGRSKVEREFDAEREVDRLWALIVASTRDPAATR